MGGGKGSRRLLAGGLIGIALVAAVGLASRAHTPAGGGHTRSISQDILLEYTLLLLGVMAVVVVPISVYLFVSGRGDDPETLPARKNWMAAVLIAMTGMSIVAIVLLTSGYWRKHHGQHDNPVAELAGLAKHGTKATRAVRFDWGPVIVVGSLVALGLAVAAWMIVQRRRTEPRPETDTATELALALELTIDDLRDEPDPRTAVIAAYAQMERALAKAGLPRDAVGGAAGVPRAGAARGRRATASVARLTDLFERAKFSPHDDRRCDEGGGDRRSRVPAGRPPRRPLIRLQTFVLRRPCWRRPVSASRWRSPPEAPRSPSTCT